MRNQALMASFARCVVVMIVKGCSAEIQLGKAKANAIATLTVDIELRRLCSTRFSWIGNKGNNLTAFIIMIRSVGLTWTEARASLYSRTTEVLTMDVMSMAGSWWPRNLLAQMIPVFRLGANGSSSPGEFEVD